MARNILIQNYHPPATKALIRDFQKIGFRVLSPDSNWGRISYYADNEGLGSELISFDEYLALPPGYVLIACKPQEEDFKTIARTHSDTMILNVAQQYHEYEPNISEVMICPDVGLFENYSSYIKHKLLYFPRPYLEHVSVKNFEESFAIRNVYSYISFPHIWPKGYSAFQRFQSLYSGSCEIYGHETSGGLLTHSECQTKMASSFLTAHFKDSEAYGLSCLESMMLGTPIVALRSLLQGTTLGSFFLDDRTAILGESVEELVYKINAVSFEDYL